MCEDLKWVELAAEGPRVEYCDYGHDTSHPKKMECIDPWMRHTPYNTVILIIVHLFPVITIKKIVI